MMHLIIFLKNIHLYYFNLYFLMNLLIHLLVMLLFMLFLLKNNLLQQLLIQVLLQLMILLSILFYLYLMLIMYLISLYDIIIFYHLKIKIIMVHDIPLCIIKYHSNIHNKYYFLRIMYISFDSNYLSCCIILIDHYIIALI